MTREAPAGVVLAAFFVGSLVTFWSAPRCAADIPPDEPPCVDGDGCGGDPTPTPTPSPTPTPNDLSAPPGPPETISPRGNVAASHFGLLWRESPNAVAYRVTLTDAITGATVHHATYAAWNICLHASCLATVAPAPGSYRWRATAVDVGGREWASAPLDIDVTTESLARLVYQQLDTGRTLVSFLRDGATVGDAPLAAPSALNARILGTADFNGDGRHDLAWQSDDTRWRIVPSVSIWEMYGATVRRGAPFEPKSLGSVAGLDGDGSPGARLMSGLRSMADFNRDGWSDLLLRSSPGEPARLCYRSNTAITAIEPLPDHGSESPASWDIVGTGDFNRDLWPDIVWTDYVSGATKIWYMRGHEKIGEPRLSQLPPHTFPFGAGDVNGDGVSDLLHGNGDGPLGAWIVRLQADGDLFIDGSVSLGPGPAVGSPRRLVAYLPPEMPRTAPVTVNGAASSVTVAPGEQVIVHVADGPGHPTDWIGNYVMGAPNDGFFPDWRYLDGSQAAPTVGRNSATLLFTMPTALGEYQFRFFANNSSNQLVATSSTVKVTVPAQITVNGQSSPLAVERGSLVSIQVSGGTARPGDWVGLYELWGSERSFKDWQFLNGAQIPPEEGLGGARLSFRLPLERGDYEFRLMHDGGYTVMAVSPKIAIRSVAKVTVNGSSFDPITVAPGAVVRVDVVDGPGMPLDWVGRHEASAPDSIHPDWKYLDGFHEGPAVGQRAATLLFTMPMEAGEYDFRLFYHHGHELLAKSPRVIVSASP